MEVQLRETWEQARKEYLASLPKDDVRRIETVGSMVDFLGRVEALKLKYQSLALPSLLARADPLISQIQSFSTIIGTFTSSHPEISALIWGSVAFVLELASRHNATFEHVIDTLEEIHRALPRFSFYLREFSPATVTANLKLSIVQYYTELIRQCQDFIRFLKTAPIKNILLFGRGSRGLARSTAARLHRLRRLTSWVDEEAHSMSLKLINEVLNVIKPTAIRRSTLPYAEVPFIRNPSFLDRPEQLEKLRTHFFPDEPSRRPFGLITASLSGAGGQGKTQIATEFVHRFTHCYDAIIWCTADSNLTLAESLATHVGGLGLCSSNSTSTDEENRAVLKRWLTQSTRICRFGGLSSSHVIVFGLRRGFAADPVHWLLVFDNLESAEVIRKCWPTGATGSILVTTRSPMLARTYSSCVIDVPLFTDVESIEFLAKIILPSFEPSTIASGDDLGILQKLAEISGNLPLLLDISRRQISATGISAAEYLSNYSTMEKTIFSDVRNPVWHPDSYPLTIVTALTLGLGKMNSSAKDVMALSAFFQPDIIPMSIFKVDSSQMYYTPGVPILSNIEDAVPVPAQLPLLTRWADNDIIDPIQFETTIGNLVQGALLKRLADRDGLQVHRITQKAILNSLSPGNRITSFNRALIRLNFLFPDVENGRPLYEVWSICERYSPHVVSLFHNYESYKEELGHPIMLCELIRRCSWYLLEKHHFVIAKAMVIESIEICYDASRLGIQTGWPTDWALSRLSVALYTQLGSIEYESHADGHGLQSAQRSKELCQNLIDRWDDDVDKEEMQKCNNNLAVKYLAEDRAQDAARILQPMYDEAKAAGPLTAMSTNYPLNLGLALDMKGLHEEARLKIEEGSEAVSRCLGDDSAEMAIAHFYHGRVLLHMKDFKAAFEAYSKCFKTRYRIMQGHPETAYVAHQLGVVTFKQGELRAAVSFLSDALRILQDIDSTSLPAARSARQLESVFEALGDSTEAAKMRKTVEECLDTHGLLVAALNNGYSEDFFNKLVLFKFS